MLSIVSAFFNDYNGVYFTAQAMKMYHDCSDVELVLVDNNPTSNISKQISNLTDFWKKGTLGAKYIPMSEPTGTSPPREMAIRSATQPYVAVIDSHVLLIPGAITRLKNIFKSGLYDNDLITGPILMDNQDSIMTHFDDVWRGQMWGVWGSAWICDCSSENDGVKFSIQESAEQKKLLYYGLLPGYVPITTCSACGKKLPSIPFPSDYRSALKENGYRQLGINNNEPPFEIAGQGLGFFAFKKSNWPGFNPDCRGFGGEEMYIHTKYRLQGGRCLSFPSLKWLHRFGRDATSSYRVTVEDKVRNYILEFNELGMDLYPIYNHFVPTHIPQNTWDWLVTDPFEHRGAPPKETATAVQGTPLVLDDQNTLEGLYQFCLTNPRDLDQHFDTLSKYASMSQSVLELTKRAESTIALLHGLPKTEDTRLVSFQTEHRSALYRKIPTSDNHRTIPIQNAKDLIHVSVTDEFDTLFIDAVHTEAAILQQLKNLAQNIKRFIIVHDTHLYAEHGEDGGPGLLIGLRKFMGEHPEWSVLYHNVKQYGLTVLTCDDSLKPKPPGVLTLAANFSQALTKHTLDGGKNVELPIYQARLEVCSTCEQRTNNVCAVCGCGLSLKASWRTSECPLARWPS